eukprot:NODE_663_length_4918_cov_0.396140.p6 type:complete len:107 gc:universal NODE_663_length_4918_cov_0.396140:2193-2513(+)
MALVNSTSSFLPKIRNFLSKLRLHRFPALVMLERPLNSELATRVSSKSLLFALLSAFAAFVLVESFSDVFLKMRENFMLTFYKNGETNHNKLKQDLHLYMVVSKEK